MSDESPKAPVLESDVERIFEAYRQKGFTVDETKDPTDETSHFASENPSDRVWRITPSGETTFISQDGNKLNPDALSEKSKVYLELRLSEEGNLCYCMASAKVPDQSFSGPIEEFEGIVETLGLEHKDISGY